MKSDELKNERWKEFLIAGDEGLFMHIPLHRESNFA